MSRGNDFERLFKKNLEKLVRPGRGKKRSLGRGGGAALAVLLLIFWFQMRGGFPPKTPVGETTTERPAATSSDDAPERETATIERCVDGDTFVVRRADGRTDRVRLIGANTPETVKPNWPEEPFGPEASAFSKRRVQEAGGVATLVADGDRRDRYGRRLAFLYLADSDISLNEELAREGLAKVETKYRYSAEMKKRLRAAEEDARKAGRGIHSLASESGRE